MQFGDKKAKRYVGPSMLCRFFMHNWAHIRVILEADKILTFTQLQQEMHYHFISGIHGKKTHTKIWPIANRLRRAKKRRLGSLRKPQSRASEQEFRTKRLHTVRDPNLCLSDFNVQLFSRRVHIPH